jgi:hypothetical protein
LLYSSENEMFLRAVAEMRALSSAIGNDRLMEGKLCARSYLC